MARNSENLAPIVLAALCMGCPVSPMDTSLDKSDVLHSLSLATTNLIFCDADVYDILTECLEELSIDAKIITFGARVGAFEQVEDLFVESELESSYT